MKLTRTILGRLAALAVVVWLLVLVYVFAYQYPSERASSDASSSQAMLVERIQRAAADIEILKRQNDELKRLLLQGSMAMAHGLASPGSGGRPSHQKQLSLPGHYSADHEKLRQRAETGVEELWMFYTGELKKLQKAVVAEPSGKAAPALAAMLKTLSDQGTAQSLTVLADLGLLSEVDSASEWRRSQLQNLTDLVQRRLHALQNPADCSTAPRLLCNLNKGCGFGCQLHHAAYCFMIAYGTRRTMILDSDGWRYSSRGWESVFLPVSERCKVTKREREEAVNWRSEDATDKIVSLPIVDGLNNRPPYMPLSFPEDLAQPLLHLHGSPPAWWAGQFVHYLMRPAGPMTAELQAAANTLKLDEGPIVGLHVRRTDKVGSEAAFHGIDEYMDWAERWFLLRQLQLGKSLRRRVFIATDDPQLIASTRAKYKEYTVLGDEKIAESAAMGSRYTDASLHGVVTDIFQLAKCDYLVCTFSSQVCRVSYELMQVWRGDAAGAVHSLDDMYYFGGQHGHEQQAWLPHTASDNTQLDLQVGDRVGVAGNHWDGWSKGTNQRTKQTGLYPSYKVRESYRIVRYPTYPQVT